MNKIELRLKDGWSNSRKVAMIKALRTITKASLLEAKNSIEALMDGSKDKLCVRTEMDLPQVQEALNLVGWDIQLYKFTTNTDELLEASNELAVRFLKAGKYTEAVAQVNISSRLEMGIDA